MPTSWMPEWYNPNVTIPTATPSPQTEYMEMVNRMMPYGSAYDVPRWAQYLYANQPQVFTGYAPQAVNAWSPFAAPQLQDTRARYDQARSTLLGEGGLDVDSPVRQWLDVITGTAQKFAPTSAAPEARRTRGQQREYEKTMSELMEQPEAYGVAKETGALWKPWLESYLAPTTQRLDTRISPTAPEWMLRSSILGPQTTKYRGNTWAQKRWL